MLSTELSIAYQALSVQKQQKVGTTDWAAYFVSCKSTKNYGTKRIYILKRSNFTDFEPTLLQKKNLPLPNLKYDYDRK